MSLDFIDYFITHKFAAKSDSEITWNICEHAHRPVLRHPVLY